MDLNIGDILNSKNFNRLMFAAAVGFGVAWYMKNDNIFFIICFVIASTYSAVTIFHKLYNLLLESLNKNKKQKVLKRKFRCDEKDHKMWVRRIFSNLGDEDKQALAEIINICEKDKQFDDTFLINTSDENYVSVINAVHMLNHSTYYRGTHGEEYLVDIFEDSPLFLIIYIDKELVRLTNNYIKSK